MADAQAYFRLAIDLIAPPPPRLIAIGGLSGTGKTAVARSLAPHVAPIPGALVLRSDIERKRLFDVRNTDRLPAKAYRPEVAKEVYRHLAERAARIVVAGHSTIVDAVFARPGERDAIKSAAHEAHVAFRSLFLVADLKTRIARVSARSLDASDADAAVARQQETYALGQLDWAQVNAPARWLIPSILPGPPSIRFDRHALTSSTPCQSCHRSDDVEFGRSGTCITIAVA